jgi:hypothetical protein
MRLILKEGRLRGRPGFLQEGFRFFHGREPSVLGARETLYLHLGTFGTKPLGINANFVPSTNSIVFLLGHNRIPCCDSMSVAILVDTMPYRLPSVQMEAAFKPSQRLTGLQRQRALFIVERGDWIK